jgi:hypothetical protein
MLISVTEAVILSGLCGERVLSIRAGSSPGFPARQQRPGGGSDPVSLSLKRNPAATASGSDDSGGCLWISTA